MTVWFGGIDRKGKPIPHTTLKRVKSDDVGWELVVMRRDVVLRATRKFLLRGVEDCWVRSISMFETKDAEEPLYRPSMILAGDQHVEEGCDLQMTFFEIRLEMPKWRE